MRMTGIAVGVALLIFVGTVRADDGVVFAVESDVLTLEDVVGLALVNNLDVISARDERQVAEGRMQEATSGALPHFALNGSYTRFDSMPEGRGDVDTYSAMLGVMQPIYTGGRVGAARRIAGSYSRAVEEEIDDIEQRIVFSVEQGFYNVLLARKDLEVATDAVRLAEENLKSVTSKYDQGVARRFDLMRAEEQLSQSQADQLRASNSVDIAKTRLFTQLRILPEQEMEIEGELKFEPEDIDYETVLELAYNNRSDLKAAAYGLAMQEDAVSLAGAGMRPTVSVVGEAGYMNPDRAAVAEWTDAWQAGVVVEIPVFDGLESRGKVKQEKARLLQYQNAYESLKDRIAEDVTESVLNYRTSRERVAAWKKSLTQSEEAYRLVTVGYREGVNQQIDVLSAQLSLTDTRRAYLLAVYDLIISNLSLQRAQGTILDNHLTEESM